MRSLCDILDANDVFVFDVDDTLLYTFRNGYRKLRIVAETLGCPILDYHEYAACYGVLSFEECLARWFPGTDVSLAIQVYRESSARVSYEAVCDFSELQSLLSQKGKVTAILTNGHNDARLLEKLNVCGVNQKFLAGLWGMEDLPAPKPSARSMQPVKDRFPARPILYIGDAAVDRDTALAAGVDFLQVCTGKDGPIPGTPSAASLEVLIDRLKTL